MNDDDDKENHGLGSPHSKHAQITEHVFGEWVCLGRLWRST